MIELLAFLNPDLVLLEFLEVGSRGLATARATY